MASPASNFDFYSKLFTRLNSGLTSYWGEVVRDTISAISPVATTLVTIYVALWGWSMMRGVISEPITDGVGRIVRLSIIVGVALNTGLYNSFLADLLWHSPDALAAAVALGYHDPGTNMQFLDGLMADFYDMGKAYNDKAYSDSGLSGIPDLSLWLTGLAIWVSGILVTGYAAFLFALSKMAIAIIIGVGPIFVLMTIFEPMKRFFDAWIGQALNYVFLVMLTAAAVRLILSIIKAYLTASGVQQAMADPSINQALPAIVFSIVGFLVLMQLPSISSALGGGVAIGTLGTVAWAYGKARGGMAAMRPTNLRRSYRRAQSDFRIVKGAASTVATMPKSIYRKITGGTRNRVERG